MRSYSITSPRTFLATFLYFYVFSCILNKDRRKFRRLMRQASTIAVSMDVLVSKTTFINSCHFPSRQNTQRADIFNFQFFFNKVSIILRDSRPIILKIV